MGSLIGPVLDDFSKVFTQVSLYSPLSFRASNGEGMMEPVCVSVPETMRLLGVGRTKVYDLINSQQLRTLKIGRRTLISTASIRSLAAEGCGRGKEQRRQGDAVFVTSSRRT